jgi:O-antigen ligase
MNWRDGIIQRSSQREEALASMKLNLSRLTSGLLQNAMFLPLIKVAFLLTIVFPCLFVFMLHRQSDAFREFEVALLSLHWMLLFCLAVWCGSFIFLTFSLKDLPLIGLLLIALAVYFIGYAPSWRGMEAIVLLAGVTLGKSAFVLLRRDEGGNNSEIRSSEFGIRNFLIGLVWLLAFASWWHLDMTNNFYHGPRWMGLWNNPNIYGMLMGAGVILAIGLLAGVRNITRAFSRRLLPAILLIAVGMMAVGLLFSYSRGAWLGTGIGLLYLAKAHGKFKWRFVLPGVFVVAAGVCLFWHSTADTGPWYLKRMDLSRPSAQHRVAAWRGAVQMMWDHPLGVGWNKAVETYEKNYSPPENGVAAIMTNDYLMLGTQLGWPGLICFVAYVALCLGAPASPRQVRCKAEPAGETPALRCAYRAGVRSCDALVAESEGDASSPGLAASQTALLTTSRDGGVATTLGDEASQLRCAYRAGALAMLVAFWFDGGLFDLPTAVTFWILLELGTSNLSSNKNGKQPTPP